MEDIMNALLKIQKELNEQKLEIRKSGENVTEQITLNLNKILEEKFATWEEKYQTLNARVENQEKRIQFMERQARQRNIVFFGIEENETSYVNLENNLIKFISDHLSIKLENRDLEAIKRVGKKGDKTRPLIATFSTLGIKINIFKQKRLLKNTPYYINDDYPKHILEKRRELNNQVIQEREKGNRAVIKYDKLIILKTSNKRSRSNSAEPIPQKLSDTSSNIKPLKKNKIQQRHQSNAVAHRSNSISEGVLKPGILNFLVNKNVNNTHKQDNDSNNEYNL